MIAIHHGTPAAVDARVREAFVEHLCQVNDDLHDEKHGILAANDELTKKNIALREEIQLHALAEKHQRLLREKTAAHLSEIKRRRQIPRSEFEHDGMLIQYLFEAIDADLEPKEVAS